MNCIEYDMEDKSAFIMAFGDAPAVKILDFLIAERGLYDYTLTDIAENSGISWATLHKVFPMFEKFNIVKETRRIGRAKLYTLNEENILVKKLIEIDKIASEMLIKTALQKQGNHAVSV